MKEKKFKKTIILVVCLMVLLIIVICAFYFYMSIQNNNSAGNSITSKDLSVTYKNTIYGNFTLDQALSEEEGLALNPYVITIENTSDSKICFGIELKEDTATMAGLNSNMFIAKDKLKLVYRKVGSTYTKPQVLDSISQGLVVKDEIETVGDAIQYEIKVWVDSDLEKEVKNKVFYGKFDVKTLPLNECEN